MNVRVGRATAILSIATAVALVCAVPAAAASPTSDLTPGATFTVWAYGAVRTVDFSGVGASGWAYQGSATYGYTVILNQTNLTAEDFELSVNRTMGAILSVEYCTPTCKSPVHTADIYYHAWESVDAWANFTVAGTVYESGSPAAAIALNNSHLQVTGNLTDSAHGPLRSSYLSAAVTSTANVQFATPLGLIPLDLASGSSWNDSAAFTASGAFSATYSYFHTGPLLNVSVPRSTIGGSVAASGNVSVIGSSGGTVSWGGVSYQTLSLEVIGPFSVREGFILVPTQVDLFGSGSSVPLTNASGEASAQMTAVDALPFAHGHFGVAGSQWLYVASALNPSVTDLTPATPAAGVDQIASGADQVASTSVQGVPMSVGQAQGDSDCLVTGTSCGAAPAAHSLLAAVGIGVGVVVVAALLGLVLITRRRQLPPPAYPNARLYPPGGSGPAGRAPRAAGPPPPPPEEDDPLSHLW